MENVDFKLNAEQQKAVAATEGPVLVIAGAGSGKTRVLTARICHLIEMGVRPYNILAITFTNKAANEMKERISLFGADDVWASTFHSMCAKILRMEIDRLGYSKDFTIYSETETERTVARLIKNPENDEEETDHDKELKKNVLWCISDAKNKNLSPEEYYKNIRNGYSNARKICDLYRKYEDELRRSNALDFDDLLIKTITLFTEYPDVLEKYSKRFEYIHVDEFQDTNRVQYQLVKLLQSYHHNLFVVGDEDQSIYSWRGSCIDNILDFPNDFPGTQVFKLERNYRSSKSILDAANNVIKNNRNRNKKVLWTDIEDSSRIEIYQAGDEREESAKIARAVYLLHQSGVPYSECAILVRTNSISRQFEEDFNLNGIPYRIFGGTKFYERKEIKDFLSYVRLAVNNKDNDSFLRATTFPSRKIGDKSREQISLGSSTYNISIYDYLNDKDLCPQALISKFSPVLEIIKDLTEKAKYMSITEFMQYVLKKSGIETALKTNKEEDLNRLENIEELVTAAEHYEKDNKEDTISDFLQSTALISDTDDMDNSEYVTIATVHAVKGLEFDNVFLPALEENIFPSYFASIENTYEEERRLMYVAITRARKRLVVTYCKQRFRFGRVEPVMKSRFVDEMELPGYLPKQPQPKKVYTQTPSNPFQERIQNLVNKGLETKAQTQFNAKANAQKFAPGVLVEHKKFGLGKILSSQVIDGDVKVTIQFPSLGVKTFSLTIAINLLKIVENPEDF
ncbi:MAG: UvrD-helicase domain-containing protein [Clostridia bacterium]|nr:UvrD-helicase domain-containing protein [Clostridia bacterium]